MSNGDSINPSRPLLGQVGAYDDSSESFENYLDRIEMFFECNDILDNKKVSTFLSIVGSQTFQLVSDLVSPKRPRECSFVEIVRALKNHYKPQVNIIAERYNFYRRMQKQNESISDFIATIKALARTCDFGSALEEQLRDKIVCGIHDIATQRSLLTIKDLSLAIAIETAHARESAARDSKIISGDTKVQPINAISNKVNYSKSSQPRHFNKGFNSAKSVSNFHHSKIKTQFVNFSCCGCGENHFRSDCPHKKATCHKCRKVGHLAKV